MSNLFAEILTTPRRWLVTGAAGFIGSHLTEQLLKLNQDVCGLDNFATGRRENLDDVKANLAAEQWKRFSFIEGDIVDSKLCQEAVKGVDVVLHQAALGSVPRSIENPAKTHAANVDGFLNVLNAGREAKVARFVYASSSSVYGDEPNLPKVEARVGRPLSPYAVTKSINELYALNFGQVYGMETVGLRYFNVFGPRQDPAGPYAAVIPRWLGQLLSGVACTIYGDGKTSRDFCFVTNAVQANLLAATTTNPQAINSVFNVAVGAQTSLTELYQLLRDELASHGVKNLPPEPLYQEFRAGDVKHSLADISRAQTLLGYNPGDDIESGIHQTVSWFLTAPRR